MAKTTFHDMTRNYRIRQIWQSCEEILILNGIRFVFTMFTGSYYRNRQRHSSNEDKCIPRRVTLARISILIRNKHITINGLQVDRNTYRFTGVVNKKACAEFTINMVVFWYSILGCDPFTLVSRFLCRLWVLWVKNSESFNTTLYRR